MAIERVSTKPAQRFEWIDVLRGLLILAVVIGHSTGKFNGYIYQFHMGAFFLVSGYLAKQGSRTFLETLYYKILTLLLPVLTSIFILQFVTYGMYKLGIYSMLLGDMQYTHFLTVLREFVFNGSILVWWLGAAWFILVLFLVSIIHRLLYQLLFEKYGLLYALVSVCLFLVGYSLSKTGGHTWNIDLVLIAQLYYTIGLYLRRYVGSLLQELKWIWAGVMAIITFVLMHIVKTTFHFSMDYPSRAFNSPAVDVFIVLNGTLFIYAVAICVGKIPGISKTISYLGQNTLPILLFHFMAFKVPFFVLYNFGIIQLKDISAFTPSNEIGQNYWWFIVPVSIAISLLLWFILMKIPGLGALYGKNKRIYELWYRKLSKNNIWLKLDKYISDIRLYRIDVQRHLNLKDMIKKYHPIIILCVAVMVLVFIPIIAQGIILNDEVQAFQYRLQGLGSLVSRNIRVELQQGRLLRIMAAVNSSMSFLFANMTASRIVQSAIIGGAVVSFGYFTWALLKDIKFSVFTCLFILIFYPVTFEHATPNAFNGLMYIPVIELFVSLALFCSYLEYPKRKYILWSGVLFVISLLGYEFMITYILLYPLVYIYKKGNCFSIKKLVKIFMPAAIVGIAYVAALYIISNFGQGNYDGTKFGFVSVKSTVTILVNLFLSALPGYWLTNKKYQYLYSIYLDGTIVSARAVLLVLIVCIIFIYLRLKETNKNNCRCSNGKISFAGFLCVGLLYSFLPASANAVSSLYQGAVTSENFTSLPVTSVLYISVCFTICFLLWNMFGKIGNDRVVCAILVAIGCSSLPVQAMNDVFAKEQNKNYQRLVCMNEIFETHTAQSLQNQVVYAEDLYKIQNALVIQDNYFTTIAAINGIEDVQFVVDKTQTYSVMIFETGVNQWTITDGDEAVILSKYRLTGTQGVRLGHDQCVYTEVIDQGRDGAFYYYYFKKNDENILKASQDVPFEDISKIGENASQTINIEYGIGADRWVEPEAEFKIATGNTGVVKLTGLYTQEITGNESISVYCGEDLLLKYPVTEEKISLEVLCSPNTVVDLKIKCNFSFEATPPDIRILSFYLSEIFAS